MAKLFSNDLRERVVSAVEEGGLSRRQATAHFDVGVSTVIEWVRRFHETGSVEPGKMGGYKPVLLKAHRDYVRARFVEQPELTLRGLQQGLADRGVEVSYGAIWAFVHAEGLSFKKIALASEQTRPDIARRRMQWKTYQGRIDPSRLVFIDETWAKTNMTRARSRRRRGARPIGRVPHGHWKTSTFVAGLRHDGITAPFVIGRPINGLIFRIYVERVQAPTLRPGDVVILDNLGSHRGAEVRCLIHARGAELRFLPPYSPDLKPIEFAFAKLNVQLRKALERSVEDLWRRIGTHLDTVTPQECRNYFRHAGYAST